jgi:two-component system phosphate regulon response regulator PhoB
MNDETNHSETLLIVDDEGNLRKLLAVTLGYGRYKQYFAVNGSEAMKIAREVRPNVIILDIMMPGSLNGLDVCRTLKNDPEFKDTYIVLLTALGQQSDREAGLAAKADAYVVKPFSPIELIELIETRPGIHQ